MDVVSIAEKEIKEYNKIAIYRDKYSGITNTQLRKIYGLCLSILDEDSTVEDIQYLKMKILYQAAKENDKKVKIFLDKTSIISMLEKASNDIENNTSTVRKEVKQIKKYMESLVGFHKYYCA